jgi:hypothetical protein
MWIGLSHRRRVRAGTGAQLKPIVRNMSAKLWHRGDGLRQHAPPSRGITRCLHTGVGGLDARSKR